jgi:O-antigen ligase
MNKLVRSHQEKGKTGFLLLNPASKAESFLLSLFFLFLPTQLGKHFWPDLSLVSGIRIDYLSPTLYTTDIILCLLFGFLVMRWLWQRLGISTSSAPKAKKSLKIYSQRRSHEFLKIKIVSKRNFFPICFLILFIAGNIIFSLRPLLSIYGWTKILELAFICVYVARTVRHQSQFRYIAVLFAISSLFESLLAIAQYINQGSLNGIFYFFGERMFTGSTPGIANASINGALILRPYATFSHPNVLAGYLLISAVLIWSFLLKSNTRWMQISGGITLLVISVALLLTFSRVAIFLWALALLLVFGRIFVRKVKTVSTKLLIAIALIIFLLFLGTFPLTHELISRFAQTSLTDESVTQRSELLNASWKIIQQYPLFGVGLDNFIPALAPLQKPMPLGLYLQPVHNIFILVLAETGIFGFGLFAFLLISTIKRVRNYKLEMRNVCFCLLVIIFVTGSLDHYWLTLQQGQLLFATVLGLSWTDSTK